MGWERSVQRYQYSYIHDHIYAPYFSQDQAKNANGGVWPTDFTKIRLRAGGINYIYNIMTGYHFKPPYGLEVPKGKYFNPYHLIYSAISITWSLVCLDSSKTEWSSTKMVPLLPLLRWLTMSPTLSSSCREDQGGEVLTKKWDNLWFLSEFWCSCPSNI